MSEKPPIDPQSVRYALGKLNDPQNSLECMKIIREFNWKQLLDENAQLRDQLAEAREVIEFYGEKHSYGRPGETPSCPDWDVGEIEGDDKGKKARAFLAKYGNKEPK